LIEKEKRLRYEETVINFIKSKKILFLKIYSDKTKEKKVFY
jgi:hypothetical protein